MAASCNQTIKITGGPGATSVQSVTYDPKKHSITITKANGATSQLDLVDQQLMAVTSDAKGMITFTVNDPRGRGTKNDITFDGSKFINVQANYTETDTAKDSYIKNKPRDLVLNMHVDPATNELKWTDELGKDHKLSLAAYKNVQANYTQTDTAKDSYVKNKPDQLVRYLNLDMQKHKLTWKDELMNPHEIDISAFAGCAHVVSGYVDPTKKELILVTQDPNNPCAGSKGHIVIDASAFFTTGGGGTGPGVSTFIALTDTANTMGKDGELVVVENGTLVFKSPTMFKISGGHYGTPTTHP